MIKINKILSLAALLFLASCNQVRESSMSGSSSLPMESTSEEMTSILSEDSSLSMPGSSSTMDESSQESSSSLLPPPVIEEKEFDYLLDTYYTKGTKAVFSSTRLTLTGDLNLLLYPSEIKTKEIQNEDGSTSQVLSACFSSLCNAGGKDYEAYVNFADGLFHLDEILSPTENKEIASFMPDISMYGGAYSEDGEGYSSSTYLLFDGTFDNERGLFNAGKRKKTSYSKEQEWSIKSGFIRKSNIVCKTVELFHDSTSKGTNIILTNGKKKTMLCDKGVDVGFPQYAGMYANYTNDAGGFGGATLFTGSKTIKTSIDSYNGDFTFDGNETSYTYSRKDDGYHLETTIKGTAYDLQVSPFGLYGKIGGNDFFYPYDTIAALYGTFRNGASTISLLKSEEQDEDILTFDSTVISSFAYVLENERKSIQFSLNNDTYILSPGKDGKSVYLIKNGISSTYFTD